MRGLGRRPVSYTHLDVYKRQVEVLMNTALPLLSGFVPEAVLNPLLAAVGIFVTGLFLSNLFYTGRKNEFGVLWMKSRRNHVPLAVLMLAGGAASCGVVAYIVHAAGARQSAVSYTHLAERGDAGRERARSRRVRDAPARRRRR